MQTHPKWWDDNKTSSWDRTKDAMKRDWEQTKHDFGGKAPDLDQDVNDTVKQATSAGHPARRRVHADGDLYSRLLPAGGGLYGCGSAAPTRSRQGDAGLMASSPRKENLKRAHLERDQTRSIAAGQGRSKAS